MIKSTKKSDALGDSDSHPQKVPPVITKEEDQPPNCHPGLSRLSDNDVESLERHLKIVKVLQAIDMRKKAFYLIIICVVVLIVLMAAETVLINFGWKISNYLSGIFELLKFLVSSLTGFVFSSKILNTDKPDGE